MLELLVSLQNLKSCKIISNPANGPSERNPKNKLAPLKHFLWPSDNTKKCRTQHRCSSFKKTFIIHHLPNISILCNQVTLKHFCFPEEIPCCPTVFPMKKVIIRGTRTSFTCKVDIKNSIPKNLVFKWYRQENGTSVEVPSSETYRHN